MSDVTRAIAAATSVAASLGLPASDAIVVHNSNRLALRLTPCDVLARVARAGHEAAQLEVELAQRLAEVGCPVGALEPRAGPLVYTRDGFKVTLWIYYEPVTPHVSPAGYARALERLHAGMRKADVPSPRFTDRIAEAEEVVASQDLSPELADADRVFLSSRLGSLRRAINGRKRHIAVDVMGLVLDVVITAASVQDRQGARPLLWNTHRACRYVRLVWADAGYTGKLSDWAASMKMTLEIVSKRDPHAFEVLPRRWVVERTFAWISKHRRTVRDYERLPASHEAMILWAMIALMTRRLSQPAQ